MFEDKIDQVLKNMQGSIKHVGRKPLNIEEKMKNLGVQVKPYYPLLSKMYSLAHIDRISSSPPDLETCVALPSDVLIHEAYSVVQSLNEL